MMWEGNRCRAEKHRRCWKVRGRTLVRRLAQLLKGFGVSSGPVAGKPFGLKVVTRTGFRSYGNRANSNGEGGIQIESARKSLSERGLQS